MSFVQFAQEQDAASFKQHFENAVQSAVAEVLEGEKHSLAQTMFTGLISQEEDLDEEVHKSAKGV